MEVPLEAPVTMMVLPGIFVSKTMGKREQRIKNEIRDVDQKPGGIQVGLSVSLKDECAGPIVLLGLTKGKCCQQQ
jgi:hypothetical protein